jgi:4-hydroxyphenylpyruvate dioxygenase-like putative hemolysin
MVPGRLYKSILEKAEVVTVKVFSGEGEDCLMIPTKYLDKIEKRTHLHKDTVTKKTLLTDLLD